MMNACRSRYGPRATIATAMILALVSGLAGCESTTPRATWESAIADYDAGRYDDAAREADGLMEDDDDTLRAEGAYLSGLVAYRRGDLRDAESRLTTAAATADDPVIAANATATLGLLRLDQSRPREAASLLGRAVDDLDPMDREQAAHYASAACLQSGDVGEARAWLAQAEHHRRTLDTAASDETATAFALQVGAFENRPRAERAARDARTANLDKPQIISKRFDDGRHLYVVRFGQFDTRREAAQMRSTLGRLDYIVVPVE